jgi:ABC-type multidrug transport system fused ATPase/permease subunit
VIRRARLISVMAALVVGAMGVISSTQTWLVAVLDDGAGHELAVTGAAAVPVLTPLSLAVLALGGWLVMQGNITLGTFLAFSTYVTQFVAPARQLAGVLTTNLGPGRA